MRTTILTLLIALLTIPAVAQQSQKQAKEVLDKAAATFKKAGGIEATFNISVVAHGQTEATDRGTIRLKGEKYKIATTDIISWFDGQTQWAYVVKNEEVNVSTPRAEDMQLTNPYSFIYMYQKGYNYAMGRVTTYRGKSVWEVTLTAIKGSQDLQRVTLYLGRSTYAPLYIETKPVGPNSITKIEITNYRTRQNYADSVFSFDPKQYPNAEVIDLR